MRSIAVCLAVASLAAPLAAQPDITLGADTLSLGPVTPGSSGVAVGVHRAATGLVPVTTTFGALDADSDNDGQLDWAIGETISDQSFWAAVDFDTSTLALAWPAALELEELTLNLATDLVAGPAGPASRLEISLPRVTLFLVRPGVGSWELVSRDGGPADLGPDDDDGLGLDLSQGVAVDGSGTSLDGALPGDFLVGCSIRDLTYFAVEVTS